MDEAEVHSNGLIESYSRISDLEGHVLVTRNLRLLRRRIVTDATGPVFWEPHGFFGNAMYLFCYWDSQAQRKNRPRPIWLTRSEELAETLRQRGYVALVWKDSQTGFETFKTLLSSTALICTNGDYIPVLGNSLVFDIFADKPVIQLWHGIATKNLERHWGEMDLTTLSSVINVVSRATHLVMPTRLKDMELSLGKPRIVSSSYPRTWKLLEAAGSLASSDLGGLFESEEQQENVPYVLYAPTFSSPEDELTQIEICHQVIRNCLADGLKMIVKPHPNHSDKFSLELRKAGFFVEDKYRDVQDLLLNARLLITDVSSVCADFLILDRPMIFTHWPSLNVVRQNVRKFLERDIPGLYSYSSEDLDIIFSRAVTADNSSKRRVARKEALHGRKGSKPAVLLFKLRLEIVLHPLIQITRRRV